jgi:hypothetical protein
MEWLYEHPGIYAMLLLMTGSATFSLVVWLLVRLAGGKTKKDSKSNNRHQSKNDSGQQGASERQSPKHHSSSVSSDSGQAH